jgi:hypothetical protein
MGCDLMWGEAAEEAGHQVCHMSFEGHRTAAPAHQVAILKPGVLSFGDEPCRVVALKLNRRWPVASSYVANLLRRNFQIVGLPSVKRCYAIGPLEANGTVGGGTGWGVEMFLARSSPGAAVPLWLFDTKNATWLQASLPGSERVWCPAEPPKPEGWYAAIGTRTYNPMFQTVIRELYGLAT